MKNRQGVTLIELLTVIAIIGIMTAVTIVYLGGAKNDKAVETAAREVASAVREAQNYALTGKNASNCIDGYTFNYTESSSNYSIRGCSDISYTLKNGVTFNGDGIINFSIPNAITDGGTIEVKKGTTSYSVCVCKSGKITEKVGNSCGAC
jgi:prepilin-type N-terminal cleavage/methylation domain-containing protein